ncbi:MAG: DNA-binding protein WhiA [Clostridiales bacterium]|nr:DNA-binding protein WhiA [Clostridiales bacterium]
MNFTGEIRRDLLKSCPEERSCCLALMAGVLDTSGSYTFEFFDGGNRGEFTFTHENEDTAEYLLALVDKLFGVSMTVANAERDPKNGRDKLTFSYFGKDAGVYADEISDFSAVNLFMYDLSEIEECRRAYVRGAFLGSGSCTLPRDGVKTGYHLEFVFPNEFDAQSFCELLDSLQLIAGILPRGEKYVVYCKSREGLADFLALVGAEGALKTLQEVAGTREENNNTNRVSNCLAGNADTAAIASAAQSVILQKMRQSGALDALSEPLKNVANARLNFPELSLSELAQKFGITKSCLNHRLRKLMEIYTKTEKQL